MKESTVFTRKYCTELTNLSMLSVFEVEIWCYRGGNTVPKWINRHDGKACFIYCCLGNIDNLLAQTHFRRYVLFKQTCPCLTIAPNPRQERMGRNIGP